ncbi:hypothetical protein MLD38_032340 [Melastoma candidum]|uniref:Uncharacterized protein n=1 Tax=Melastoma candidum TaxID=119954 RepID=A0ACB9M5K8_9MYRT|nr:hypothetical protein MLD38_032340 [Melastoma candidum]
MAAAAAPTLTRPRVSSFSRSTQLSGLSIPLPPGIRTGPNSTAFVSSGIPTLDAILGGGYCLGSLVMVMEDPDAPHHMLLLRSFMSQGIVHDQPLLYASPAEEPRRFLGTLPSPACSTADKSPRRDREEDKGLRIAWQYKKYFDETHQSISSRKDNEIEYSSDFDLRKPLQRQFISGRKIECISILKNSDLAAFHDRCGVFLNQHARKEGSILGACRISIQSFCAPQCEYFNQEWQVLSFLRSLRSMVKSSNSVAVLTFSPSLLPPSSLKRWQHLADILISVRAIPDDDKDMAKLLTGYQDMVGLLNIHKIARPNVQVPFILDATMFSMKLQKRKYLIMECLNQAPVDGSGGSSYAASGTGSCSSASKTGPLDF